MSVEKSVDVFCDTCSAWIHGAMNITVVEARRIAKHCYGYKYIKGKDICPDCQTDE